jgi:hypothetical protein
VARDIGGGIVLVTGGEPGGPHFGPLGDTLPKNVAFRNKPFGTFWDRTDRIRFRTTAAPSPSPDACATDLSDRCSLV